MALHISRTLRTLIRGLPLCTACAAGLIAPPLTGCVCHTPDFTMRELTRVTITETEADLETIRLRCASYCRDAGHGIPDACDVIDTTTVECTYTTTHQSCVGGRRPLGPSAGMRTDACDDVRRWLLDNAALELLSVPAFAHVRDTLAHHGAPRDLVQRAARAIDDESRHARMLVALAGNAEVSVTAEARAPHDLETFATHNAAEGCVREAFAALAARHQAEHAHAPSLRAAMRTIARDEAEHARLAFDVARLAKRRLGHAANARVEATRRAAWHTLRRELTAAPPRSKALGLPPAHVAQRMLRALA